jgi:hypothetical protein
MSTIHYASDTITFWEIRATFRRELGLCDTCDRANPAPNVSCGHKHEHGGCLRFYLRDKQETRFSFFMDFEILPNEQLSVHEPCFAGTFMMDFEKMAMDIYGFVLSHMKEVFE